MFKKFLLLSALLAPLLVFAKDKRLNADERNQSTLPLRQLMQYSPRLYVEAFGVGSNGMISSWLSNDEDESSDSLESKTQKSESQHSVQTVVTNSLLNSARDVHKKGKKAEKKKKRKAQKEGKPR